MSETRGSRTHRNIREMKMKNPCLYKIYFAILLCGRLFASDLSEPQCYSRFDYDEKMLKKMLKIEDEIEKFRKYVDELKLKEDKVQQQSDELKSKETSLDLQREQEHEQFMAAMEKVDTFLNAYTRVKDSLKVLDVELAKVKEMTGPDSYVAFTVRDPISQNGDYMPFNTVDTNEGEGFDAATGKFTCNVPGLYYFSAHVLKVSSKGTTSAYCYICKNGSKLVLAYSGPGTSTDTNGYYGWSNSVNIRLVKDDVVGLCGCTGHSTFDPSSSFSGHLIR